MKRLSILFVSVLCGCTHGGLVVENDYLAVLGPNTDRYYTHGTKFYVREKENTYAAGQGIYTPANKGANQDPSVFKGDRPYSGWLYAEYRTEKKRSENDTTTYGLQIGCVGPCSFAKTSQTLVHKALGQRVPSWDTRFEQKSEPGFIAEYEKEHYVFRNSFSDFRGYLLGKFGNIVDSASLGSLLRIGALPSLEDGVHPITFKLPEKASDITCYLFLQGEGRVVPYNHLLEGSLFQEERYTVRTKRLLGEGIVGVAIGYGSFEVLFGVNRFTEEWKGGGPFTFGTIKIGW